VQIAVETKLLIEPIVERPQARIEREHWLCFPVPPTTNKRLTPAIRTAKDGHKYAGLARRGDRTGYQETVKKLCMIARIKPISGDVRMDIKWYRADKRGDVPDRFKDLCDALQGWAYHNDSQIAEFEVRRSDAEPKNPRIIVMVKKL
jgi:Holliday junction resolvase RusA-like endonuclease